MKALREFFLVLVGGGIVWAAVSLIDLVNRRPEEPPAETTHQSDMAKECRTNGGEIGKALPDETKQELIHSIKETAGHVLTLTVDEEGWNDAGDVVQATVEISGFCRVSTLAGEGTVIILGENSGKELERYVNGTVIPNDKVKAP